MTRGMPALLSRLWNFSLRSAADEPERHRQPSPLDRSELTEQQMRDIGMIDGRTSRQALPRRERRREQWWGVEPPPRL
ncbi:hypothetical protein ACFFP0_03100 [Rhizobium puerariae]|uniref:DUF1127 domain-containing protein n=1 Tax=Rhizobium puerariae TaxID=1585791 RepID=A0ABV6AB14_9HYPH